MQKFDFAPQFSFLEIVASELGRYCCLFKGHHITLSPSFKNFCLTTNWGECMCGYWIGRERVGHFHHHTDKQTWSAGHTSLSIWSMSPQTVSQLMHSIWSSVQEQHSTKPLYITGWAGLGKIHWKIIERYRYAYILSDSTTCRFGVQMYHWYFSPNPMDMDVQLSWWRSEVRRGMMGEGCVTQI